MTQTDTSFTGNIADAYHDYLVPLIFDDYAHYMARRVTPVAGERVLEIACGTGALTRHLSDSLDENCRLVATDINPEMVEAAKKNVSADEGIEFRPADGTALPFEDNTFDVVVCQFGVMFFADRDRGYAEISRVLKPGGRFLFNVWDSLDRNRLAGMVHDEIAQLVPEDPPRFLEVPFGYHDISEIAGDLQRAGFEGSDVTVMPRMSRAETAEDVARALVFGSPLGTELSDRGLAESAKEAVESAVIHRFGDGEVIAPMQSIVFEAELPMTA